MIKAKDILRTVRYKVKDNDEILYSDYDIKNAMNEALRYIVQSHSLRNSDYLEVNVNFDQDALNQEIMEYNEAIMQQPEYSEDDLKPLYDFRKTGIDLPEDFLVLGGVTRGDGYLMRPCDSSRIPAITEYKIMGDKIYSGSKSFRFTYKRSILAVSDLENDVIDLPEFCFDLVVKITNMIMNQAENDILLKTIESMAKAVIPKRKYNNAQIRMPFYC